MRLKSGCRIVHFRGMHLLTLSFGISHESYEVNESFAFLVEHFKDTSFSVEDVASVLSHEYCLTGEDAYGEALNVIGLWSDYGMIQYS